MSGLITPAFKLSNIIRAGTPPKKLKAFIWS